MHSLPLLIFSFPLLLNCTLPPASIEPVTSVPTTDISTLPDTIQTQVRSDLANHLSVPTDQVTIQSYRRQTWSDGCLGLGGPAELCLAALTDGWQVEALDTETNKVYGYRTNLNGAHIRREF